MMSAQKAMPLLQLLWKFFTSTRPLTVSPDSTCDASKGLSSALAPLPSATLVRVRVRARARVRVRVRVRARLRVRVRDWG